MIVGKILSEGIGIGVIQKLESFHYIYSETKIAPALCDTEIERFLQARTLAANQIECLQSKAEAELGAEQAEIFAGHLEMILDDELANEITSLINTGMPADNAVYLVFKPQIDAVKSKTDEYLAARAADLEDLRDRLLKNILGKNPEAKISSAPEVIICCEDLTPSQTAQLDMTNVKGIVINTGGFSSHSAIMARNLALPLILVKKPIAEFNNDDTLIVDCFKSAVYENPEAAVIAQYREKIITIKKRQEYWQTLRSMPAETADGKKIRLFANIGSDSDLANVLEHGAEGIGLLRTEFLFMEKSSAPSETAQFHVYKKIAEAMGEKPVIVRTFDFGGDKKIPYLNLPDEENPFLGLRSVRLYEKEFTLFATQLRAIIRAGAFGNIKVMYPLISSVTEFRKISALADKVAATLPDEEQAIYRKMEKGIMVETPASVLLADHLIADCDFFSIGSNDLTQYTIAVDRGNTELLELFDPFNPAVLRLINMSIQASHAQNKWTGLCGEFASDINGALILSGLGIDELSMAAKCIPEIKEVLRKVTYAELQALAAKVLGFATSAEVLECIDNFRKKYDA